MAKKAKKKDHSLIELINQDPKLEQSDKFEYTGLANLFLQDFNNNLYKSSIDLGLETGIDADTWRKFLSYPAIKKYLNSFIKESITKQADQKLTSGQGTRDAIAVRKIMREEGDQEDNSRFVILRLPDRTDDLDE